MMDTALPLRGFGAIAERRRRRLIMERILRLFRGRPKTTEPSEKTMLQSEAVSAGVVRLGTAIRPTVFSLPSGTVLSVPTQSLRFKRWAGAPIADTYGGKALIDSDGVPKFAELAVLRLLQKQGWDGRWVDTYRGKFRTGWPDVSPLPPQQQALFDRIVTANGGRKGCWDVFAWRDESVLFVECKRTGKDKIRDSQVGWLAAAITVGVLTDSFIVVEWDV